MAKLYKGIDISFYQGDVDFNKVRDAGIDFVIVRASQGRLPGVCDRPYVDSKFHANVKKLAATKGRIYGGSYHLLAARTLAEADEEADFYINLLKPYRFNLQLWAVVDVEYSILPTDKALLTAIVKRFCDKVAAAGFRPMVYSTKYWTQTRFSLPAGVPFWEAHWSRTTFPDGAKIWQKGVARAPGVAGDVDYNLAYGIMGDANGDGQVNAKDVTAAMKYLVKKKGVTINESQMDFDRDGKVTAKDVTALMKALV